MGRFLRAYEGLAEEGQSDTHDGRVCEILAVRSSNATKVAGSEEYFDNLQN